MEEKRKEKEMIKTEGLYKNNKLFFLSIVLLCCFIMCLLPYVFRWL
jgi:hypothetical protein